MTIEAIFRDLFLEVDRNSSQVLDLWRRARARARTMANGIRQVSRRSPRRLRLCESLPLGERRFVAVVEFEQSRFLVGGTSASLVLLARLEDAPEIPATYSIAGVIPQAAAREGSS
jgi:hypothetical protein